MSYWDGSLEMKCPRCGRLLKVNIFGKKEEVLAQCPECGLFFNEDKQ